MKAKNYAKIVSSHALVGIAGDESADQNRPFEVFMIES